MPNADIQSECLLTDSAFTALHKLGDFGNRCLTLRMHLEVADVFFSPRNSLTASISCFGFMAMKSVHSCFCNKRFVVLLDGEASKRVRGYLGRHPVFVGTRVPVGFSTVMCDGFPGAITRWLKPNPRWSADFPCPIPRGRAYGRLFECFRGSGADWPAVPTSMEAVAAISSS